MTNTVNAESLDKKTKEALLYQRERGKQIRCQLCASHCLPNDGQKGICQARRNDGGTLFSPVYGRLIGHAVYPIEKKPLFHYHPASRTYSIGVLGCNFYCPWCQNWEISRVPLARHVIEEEVSAECIVAAALQADCRIIAYTYTEPTISFEFAYETARLAHESELTNVFVTNGSMS
jgi:pyruvate formate lyase activating enzyme